MRKTSTARLRRGLPLGKPALPLGAGAACPSANYRYHSNSNAQCPLQYPQISRTSTPPVSPDDLNETVHLADSHDWHRRNVVVNGNPVFHRQCRTCRRDFVMAADAGCWRAVHIGLLRFDFLDEETNRRWVSEDCPGWQIAEDINDPPSAESGPSSPALRVSEKRMNRRS